jgi:hypothetical protein
LAAPTTGILIRVVEDSDRVDEALAVAEQEGIAVLEGDAVVFSHPLLRSGVFASLSRRERLKVHQHLARLLPPGEERARHMALASSPPAEDVARELQESALQAASRGAPAAATELAELSFRFTAADRPHTGLRRMLAAMDFALAAGDMDRLRRLVTEAMAQDHTETDLAEVLLRAALVEPRIDASLERIRTALDHASNDVRLRPEPFTTSPRSPGTPDHGPTRSTTPPRQSKPRCLPKIPALSSRRSAF